MDIKKKNVPWYPWLNEHYKKIITQYYGKKNHPVLLIQSSPGIGIYSLVWAINKWLLCSKKKNLKVVENV
ncbi:hypothetical protein D9V80_01380 [Buchnera aphidicola (Thelaxes californica)]|uniref:Uncharacterized protein n=1 Tax=Buchnera aphidicola (Thelaxes californica) TaxID=1315998 RepID=A0A4D6YAG6_9GAMM|nr:hypothetical protein [Buchnera aphidicola]QCI26807.1 hypothetical protein D9V80_01380 [Buchnera aphidicola (Thelaxes californica)]